jgi:predicted Zn-dependent peptidase
MAEYIYESDNQSTLARRYGGGLVIGRTIADIDAWPVRISQVTLEAVKKAATYRWRPNPPLPLPPPQAVAKSET